MTNIHLFWILIFDYEIILQIVLMHDLYNHQAGYLAATALYSF